MIKTGISLSYPLITPELFRLLKKHPDIEICQIEGAKDNSTYHQELFETLQEEIKGIPIALSPEEMDFSELDLYIGPSNKLLPENREFKAIFTDSGTGELGVCEFNRKALVRGATEVTLPDLPTILGALALMPLAKNLLLNSPISVTMLLPVDRLGSRSSFTVPNSGLTSDNLNILREKILTVLQNSFNSPVDISTICSTVSSFACAVFNTGVKISSEQARELFMDLYSDHRHIYFPEGTISERMVIGTNKTIISLRNDSLGKLVVNVACDGLYKGGAGNIVHILNLLFGLDERTGL